VGKPIKHLLQLDAAKRVFNQVLQPLGCSWDLEVINTGGSGLKLVLSLKGSTEASRRHAEQILSAFSTPYLIQEATA
jgi:fatty-acyl-CoA synthase